LVSGDLPGKIATVKSVLRFGFEPLLELALPIRNIILPVALLNVQADGRPITQWAERHNFTDLVLPKCHD
jgi:hypothetical protein